MWGVVHLLYLLLYMWGVLEWWVGASSSQGKSRQTWCLRLWMFSLHSWPPNGQWEETPRGSRGNLFASLRGFVIMHEKRVGFGFGEAGFLWQATHLTSLPCHLNRHVKGDDNNNNNYVLWWMTFGYKIHLHENSECCRLGGSFNETSVPLQPSVRTL